ncbi:MAG: hypothetical protein R6V03_06690, partial [Kiritimatiellia bacterium]
EYTRLPDHQLKRAMRSLVDLEYLHVRRSGRGGSYVYRLAGHADRQDHLEGLTTPEELRKTWKEGVNPSTRSACSGSSEA